MYRVLTYGIVLIPFSIIGFYDDGITGMFVGLSVAGFLIVLDEFIER